MNKNKRGSFIPAAKLDKLDRYIAFLTGDEESLSPAEQEEFALLSLVDDQLRLSRSWQKIQRIVSIKYGKEWSKATTFRWISYAKYVFGSSSHIDKDYERQRILHWFEMGIQMAIKEKDYWFLGKQLKAYADIAKLNEPEAADDAKFTPHQYILNIINAAGRPTQLDIGNPLDIAPEDRRSVALRAQQFSLPETLDDAINLEPPEPSDSLDDDE